MVASFSSLRVGFACGGKFFQVGNASYVVLCACGVVGVDEAKAFAVFRPCWLEGLSKVCLCFGLFCCLACCWVSGATRVVVL